MKTRTRRASAAILVSAVLPLTMANCGSGSSSSGSSSAAPARTSKPDYFGCNTGDAFLCSSGPAVGGGGAAAGGVATADAGPIPTRTAESSGGNDCGFYYHPDSSGLEVQDHVLVVGSVSVACILTPKSLSVATNIYWLQPLAKSYIAVGVGGAAFPGPALTAPIDAHAPCRPGLYYLEMYAHGKSSTYKPFDVHVLGDIFKVDASARCVS